MTELPGGTVTLLFADLETAGEGTGALGPQPVDVLARTRSILGEACSSVAGQQVDTTGGGFLAVFLWAKDATVAAAAAQRAFADENWHDGRDIRLRLAIHTTALLTHADGYIGRGVQRAARLCAAAHGGQVLLSAIVRDLVKDDLPPRTSLRDLGEVLLEDSPKGERVFQLVIEGLPGSFPSLRDGDIDLAWLVDEEAVARDLSYSIARLAPPSTDGPRYRLRFASGPNERSPIMIADTPVLVGRDASSDAVIDDEKISRRHAELRLTADGEVELHDLGSVNGTFVDGRRMTGRVRLHGGERIRFGRSQFVLEGEGAASEPRRVAATRLDEGPPPESAGSGPDLLTLEVVEGPEAGRRVELRPGDDIDIGRSLDGDGGLDLNDAQVSRRHARLRIDRPGVAVLEDLGSRNGTFVNGSEAHGPTTVQPGDVIEAGTSAIELRSPAQVRARPSVVRALPPAFRLVESVPDYVDEQVLVPVRDSPSLEALLDSRVKRQARTAPLALFLLVAFVVLLYFAAR